MVLVLSFPLSLILNNNKVFFNFFNKCYKFLQFHERISTISFSISFFSVAFHLFLLIRILIMMMLMLFNFLNSTLIFLLPILFLVHFTPHVSLITLSLPVQSSFPSLTRLSPQGYFLLCQVNAGCTRSQFPFSCFKLDENQMVKNY